MVIETGLSDFHKMCITVTKMYYSEHKHSIIRFRKFKDFNNDGFTKEIKTFLSRSLNEETIPFQALRESVNATLEKHAPSKVRYTRANQAPYMNKKLSKEIMKRSRLRNKFLNTKSDLDRKAYNKQRNYVVSLLRKEKKEFYGNLNTSVLTENRTFWKTVKPFLAEKSKKVFKITLIEDNQVISQDKEIAKTFNEYCISIPILNMPTKQDFEYSDSPEEDSFLRIIGKCQNDPSIKFIKSKYKSQTFKFRETNTDEIKTSIENLNPKKASQKSDTNTNIRKMQLFLAKYAFDDINSSIRSSKFHNELKQSDIVPIRKKNS